MRSETDVVITLPRRMCVRNIVTAVLVGVLAVAFLQPLALNSVTPTGDTERFVVSTINFVHEVGRPPVYLTGNAYMAPILEVVAAFTATNLENCMRTFAVLEVGFIGASAAMLFLNIEHLYGFAFAVACGVLYALPATGAAERRFLPGYPFGLFLTSAYLAFAGRPTSRSPLFGGLWGGIVDYVYPVALPYVVVLCAAEIVRQLSETKDLWLWRRVAAVLGTGLIAATPGAYYYLQRGSVDTPVFRGLLVVAAVMVIVALWMALGLSTRPNTLPTMRWAVEFSSAFAIIHVMHRIAFRALDLPLLTTRGVPINRGNDYHFLSYPEWPYQLVRLMLRVVPVGTFPAVSTPLLAKYNTHSFDFDPVLYTLGLVSLSLIFVGSWKLFRECHAGGWQEKYVYPVSSLVTLVVLFPSVQLYSDYSVRYLAPFLPGLWITMLYALRKSDYARSSTKPKRTEPISSLPRSIDGA
ncbi:MAG: hypothetical protein ABL995_14690 [Bryobacteraceae bacterium]